MSKICPKCGYQRQPTDYNPEWECPNCHVAYDKVMQKSRQGVANPIDASGKPPQKRISFARIVLLLIMGGLVIVGYGVYQSNYKAQSSLSCGENTNVCIEWIQKGGSIRYMCHNKNPAPITLYFDSTVKNITLDTSDSLVRSIPAESSRVLSTGTIIRNGEGYYWDYEYIFRYGDMGANHDSDAVYRLPYRPNASFKVIQSHNGSFSHNNTENRYAIDFDMPIGAPVCAARNGYVVLVKSDSDVGGPTDDYFDDANFIQIAHDDGTVAIYAHLKRGGAAVKKGDFVKQGRVIGYSGNTGFSTRPHLHFNVVKPGEENTIQSIAVTFFTGEEYISDLETNRFYRAAY